MLDDGILASQPSPQGEGAPQGRIGHRRHERQMMQMEKRFCTSELFTKAPYPPLTRSPFPDGEGLGGAALRVDFYKERCPKVVSSHQPLETTHPCFYATGVNGFSGFRRFKGFRWRLRRILDDGIPVSSAFPSRGRCPEGADRAQAA